MSSRRSAHVPRASSLGPVGFGVRALVDRVPAGTRDGGGSLWQESRQYCQRRRFEVGEDGTGSRCGRRCWFSGIVVGSRGGDARPTRAGARQPCRRCRPTPHAAASAAAGLTRPERPPHPRRESARRRRRSSSPTSRSTEPLTRNSKAQLIEPRESRAARTQPSRRRPPTATPGVGGFAPGSGYALHHGFVPGRGQPFDPSRPLSLIYAGTSPSSEITGLMYYGISPRGAPPGFRGAERSLAPPQQRLHQEYGSAGASRRRSPRMPTSPRRSAPRWAAATCRPRPGWCTPWVVARLGEPRGRARAR